jgi:hypothetical protein
MTALLDGFDYCITGQLHLVVFALVSNDRSLYVPEKIVTRDVAVISGRNTIVSISTYSSAA